MSSSDRRNSNANQSASVTVILILFLVTIISNPTMAGRNANGAMLLHVNNALNYSALQPYCDNTLYPIPQDCNGLVTNVTKSPDVEAMIWMVGAFELGASPTVNAYQVGLGGDVTNAYFTDWAPCGTGFFEIPDAGWPGAGTGTAVAYPAPITDHLFKMYWFAAGAPGAGSTLSTTNYYAGDHHAEWVDNSAPPIVDFCSLFGAVQWGGPGALNCPNPPQTGACCLCDGSCQDLLQDTCASLGGTFGGLGTACATWACPPPPGACCFPDGSCQDECMTQDQCTAEGGTFEGVGTSCFTFQCPVTIGACCVCEVCMIETQDQCSQMGGFYGGDGTNCDPPVCVPPPGACCYPDGSCNWIPECECPTGDWRPGMLCDPNPCLPTPTKATTWGRIKQGYRDATR